MAEKYKKKITAFKKKEEASQEKCQKCWNGEKKKKRSTKKQKRKGIEKRISDKIFAQTRRKEKDRIGIVKEKKGRNC